MKDDTVSRAAVMQSLTREYNRRRTGDGLKLAWIEKAVDEVPAVQTCEDAVNRQQAIDAVLRAEALVRAYGYRYAADAVRELPAVHPQRKTGKWIDDGVYGDYHSHHAWHCSECEESVIEIDTPWFKFCPNCGADMRGENR